MLKVKFKFSNIFSLIKCSLLGVVFTLLGTVLFAVVLKWVDVSSLAIDYINNAIIGLSIFFMIMCINKMSVDSLILRSLFAGLLYGLISFFIFSILNGGMVYDMSVLFDITYAIIVSLISAVIIKIFRKKTM
ncbi:MAG: hypothetical protein IKC49_00305 [Clostridia bacterium]|nr:hypothetical protein [Clostridia bacterium]